MEAVRRGDPWASRETPGGRSVDWLGKHVDNSAWHLCKNAQVLQIEVLLTSGGKDNG